MVDLVLQELGVVLAELDLVLVSVHPTIYLTTESSNAGDRAVPGWGVDGGGLRGERERAASRVARGDLWLDDGSMKLHIRSAPIVLLLLACNRPAGVQEPKGKAVVAATDDGGSCASTDRTVTLVNQCGDTVYAAGVGNAGANCQTNADCGVDQFCATPITSFTATKCSTDADCSGVNEGFCQDDKCAFHQCFFVPLGGEVTPGETACSQNSDCPSDQYCSTSTQTCAALASDGNGWELAAGESVTLCAPTPWAGRFWPRTGCDSQTLECATGQCVGADGKTVSLNCGLSGAAPATLAELNMQTFSAQGDFYDLSMVDGGNLAVSVVPSSFVDDSSNTNLISATSCSSDQDCPALWRCDSGLAKCVNPLECGSAGCTDSAGCAASAISSSLLPACSWGGSGFAVAQDSCDTDTQVLSGGTYYGCIAPQKLCGTANEPAGLDCGDAPPCSSDSDCASGSSCVSDACVVPCKSDSDCASGSSCVNDACTGTATSNSLYGCSGAANSGSCYSDLSCASDSDCTSQLPPGFSCDTGSGKCVDPNCCGCPTTWAPASLCVAGDNPEWHAVAEPFAATFNSACGSAYSFAFDDTTKLMSCHGISASQNVDYTVTFCP